MKDEIKRKRICIRSKQKDTAGNLTQVTGGDYFCDYSPRYTEEYSIYEKAKAHVKGQKKENQKNLKKIVDNE